MGAGLPLLGVFFVLSVENPIEFREKAGYNIIGHFPMKIDNTLFLEEFLMIEIKKDTIIGDILDVAPQTAPIFFSIGMHCLGCPSSRGETVEEACMVHGVDVDKLLELVNEEANKEI